MKKELRKPSNTEAEKWTGITRGGGGHKLESQREQHILKSRGAGGATQTEPLI